MKNDEPIRLLNSQELTKLGKLLEKEEQNIKKQNALNFISGGFSKCEMFGYDNKFIDIIATFGCQSDADNSVYSENLKVNRKTFEII